jgi:hypothetical protein
MGWTKGEWIKGVAHWRERGVCQRRVGLRNITDRLDSRCAQAGLARSRSANT